MTTFEKTHPTIRNERGCLTDRLPPAVIIFTSTALYRGEALCSECIPTHFRDGLVEEFPELDKNEK